MDLPTTAPRRPRLIPLLFAAWGFFGSGCERSDPRLTLRQVMFEMDHADRAIRTDVGRAEAAARTLERVREIERWMEHPSFGDYAGKASFRGDAQALEEHRRTFLATVRELGAALEEGRHGDSTALYARMRMSCEVCHLEFRPALPVPALPVPGGPGGPGGSEGMRGGG